ncbi:MAG: acetoin dehydrogenase dihydrolipoyllysine-residue acetyltransferase subunit, partial [Pseudomonadota bacterium]
ALSRLTSPTRIIWGKRDRIIPWKHALRAPGDVALHLFENMGHIPHLEAPDAIGRILAKPL